VVRVGSVGRINGFSQSTFGDVILLSTVHRQILCWNTRLSASNVKEPKQSLAIQETFDNDDAVLLESTFIWMDKLFTDDQ